MRTRSQGLSAPVTQDLERDLLLAAGSISEKVVQDLMKKYKKLITYHPDLKLNAVRNQLLRQMGYPTVREAVSSPPSPSPVPETAVNVVLRSPPVCVDTVPSPIPSPPVPDMSVETSFVNESGSPVVAEGSPDPLTLCDTQCSGCLTLQSENARLQQAEQQASERFAMLEAENQHLRLLSQNREMPQQAADRAPGADTAPARIAGPIAQCCTSSVPRPPPPTVRVAKNLQVVVHGLRVKGNASHGLLLSAIKFSSEDLEGARHAR